MSKANDNFNPHEFGEIMHDLIELHKRKNHDYAGGDYFDSKKNPKEPPVLVLPAELKLEILAKQS